MTSEGPPQKRTRGVVFNIQRYSIHDGPGIRTTVFLKGCPLRCFWCQNPESQKTRPEVFLKKSACLLCGRCVAACPEGASSIVDGICVIDRKKCSGCGTCVEVCSNDARTLMGRWASVDEVMSEVLRDKRFYANSGGGVTLSGGDPTAQPRFALALLQACKAAGLHTAIETCGCTSWRVFSRLLEHVDLVLFDIKHLDSGKHREGTGRPNALILENAARIARSKPMRVRVPVIPGFNDSPEAIRAIARFVREELGALEIDLLPYNRMGESKYEFLGRASFQAESGKDEDIERLQAALRLECVTS
jgi:pyruvate formate lyase activating enzyme